MRPTIYHRFLTLGGGGEPSFNISAYPAGPPRNYSLRRPHRVVAPLRAKRIPLFYIIVLCLAVLGLTAACGGGGEAAKPTVRITTLENESQVNVGQETPVGFEASDVEGVIQVELTINGEPTYVEASDPPVNVFSGSYTWVPDQTGSYLIQVVAFNVEGEVSEPAQVAVRVASSEVAFEPTPTISPVEPAPGATTPPAAATILVPPTPSGSTPPPVGGETRPLVTTRVGLNVRAGPGTNYPVLGRLTEGETAEITGRDANSAWWQIVYASESGDRGWVAADANFSTATNAANAPVVEAPPPPDPGPNPPPETGKPVIYSFTAERETIAEGESVVLRWELENAREAYLRYEGKEEGVVSPGSKRVSPNEKTEYTLLARNDAGETTAEVTINVTEAASTPVPVLRDGRVAIVNGQAIDFDEGVIQDDSGSEIDFVWDLRQGGFLRRNGAIGTLIGASFDETTFEDCAGASYGDPLSDVDITGAVVGCYRTSEDRFGKFAITAWDLSGKLTIDWLTWDN